METMINKIKKENREKMLQVEKEKLKKMIDDREINYIENIAIQGKIQNILHDIERTDTDKHTDKVGYFNRLKKARIKRRCINNDIDLLNNMINIQERMISTIKDRIKYYNNVVYLPRPETFQRVKEMQDKKKINKN